MRSILINITLGFILPWIFGVFLYKRASKIVIIIYPISSVVSSFINTIGFHLEFWSFTPLIEDNSTISALPFDLGLYPLTACLVIYFIHFRTLNPIVSLLIFSALLTGLEYIGLLIHKVEYDHGWNIGWTFVSYVIAATAAYGYYVFAKKHGIDFESNTKNRI
ncbi:CBO0543 family protein [Paenibacillus alginolyticus]|uniref:Uncharacterized protein n=1 Tax=Paenibacillus alginolyticus TaxID=59839 RepID=A0ABT4G7V0_9BACL|nr:CBO0543 family protein [Paenibacillus alginolyticus]MCY9692267.1 hypothetical protein [Paenibacillus alginolyticus]MEC0145891.1 hypothetical protein [Paenibacillus alginolyticus]